MDQYIFKKDEYTKIKYSTRYESVWNSSKKTLIYYFSDCSSCVNGIMALTTDSLADRQFKIYLSDTLPQLAYLKSVHWRNWKLNELITGSFVENSTSITNVHSDYANAYISAVDFEISQLKPNLMKQDINITDLFGHMKTNIRQSFPTGTITNNYDANLLTMDEAF